MTLTPEQAADIRGRIDAKSAWLRSIKRNSYKTEELEAAGLLPVSNEETSALEVFEFIRDEPERYFGYVKCPEFSGARASFAAYSALYGRTGEFTTWTGDKLGVVQFGRAWRDNFSGIRVPISVKAITGDLYHGYYYASSGDFARVRKGKARVNTSLRVSV